MINGDQSNNSRYRSGACYIFSRNATNMWSQEAYIKGDRLASSNNFGSDLALSANGDQLVVGSPRDGFGGPNSGSSYVFNRTGTLWMQTAYLKASNADAFDSFGYAVSMSSDGSYIVVGANQEYSGVSNNETDNSTPNAGAAFIFYKASDGSWSQQAYLKASQPKAQDNFGCSVALSSDGKICVVGANGEDSVAQDSGSSFVFVRTGVNWSLQTMLKASNAGVGDEFGTKVDISSDGTIIAVGAYREDSRSTGVNQDQNNDLAYDSGAVYLYRLFGSKWRQIAYVKASIAEGTSGAGGAWFGSALSLSFDGQSLLVGSLSENGDSTGFVICYSLFVHLKIFLRCQRRSNPKCEPV